MPELPDVEAVIGRIQGKLSGRRIRVVEVLDRKLVSKRELQKLRGKRIVNLRRRGKYIFFSLNDGTTIAIHLRMTGNLLISDPEDAVEPDTRIVIHLDSGRQLRFVDRRRLGVIHIVDGLDFNKLPGLKKMGPEPLADDFTLGVFRNLLSGRRCGIKSLLLDQGFVAGIGNIYGDEILFQSGIRPSTRVNDLTEDQINLLHLKIREVLNAACGHNANISGMKGWFVQGRRRGYCIRCKCRIERVRIRGRYSYFCPRCQR